MILDKHFYIFYIFITSAVVFLIWMGWLFPNLETLIIHPEQAVAATSSAVSVSATVEAAISCDNSATSTSFGTLTNTAVSNSTPNATTTLSCANAASGCTLNVRDAYAGLFATTTASKIKSPNASFSATSTLVAGTEGYGVQAATSTAGTGSIALSFRYDRGVLNNNGANTVGGLATSSLVVASSSAGVSGKEIIVFHKAAISGTTKADSYNDTITYECLQN